MPHSAPFVPATPRWRVALLTALVLALMVVPAAVLRNAAQHLQDALGSVSHTQQVRAKAFEMLYTLRELEVGALVLNAGFDNERIRRTFAENRGKVRQLGRELAALTVDNPAQQRRIGEVQAILENRAVAAERLAALPVGSRSRPAVQHMVTENYIRTKALEIIAAESRLLGKRQAEAERLRVQSGVLRVGALLAQLVLLGGLIYVWQLQLRGRQRAESEILRASARAHLVLQTVREPIVLIDAEQHVVMHNAAFAELYGVAGDDAVGQRLAEVGGGAWSNAETLQRLRDVIGRGRELWDHGHSQRTADGMERSMLINARQMVIPGHNGPVALVTVSDVTAQKASEQRIQELNRQLEGKVEQVSDINRELEAFSYSVSHDLRAPLRHIDGFASKLSRHLGEQADDKARHYLDVIGNSARRMSALIDDLLVYSRLGRSVLRLQPVDMQSLVSDVRSMLDANAAADMPGHRIDWRVGALPVVAGDENMLRQVWQNLLGNAVKYSARREPAVIEVSHRYDAEGQHHFTVSDNGAGFDMAYAGKLFGVFHRLHKASDYAGTGIGLASVRRVLGRHGGQVWAEAEPDAGATFHFTLPATLSHATPADEAA